MGRSDQTATERRRRNGDALQGRRNRLHVDETQLDRENYEYRFVNDVPGRIHAFTVKDDWEMVPDRDNIVKADGIGAGTEVAAHAGIGPSGAPMRSVLLRKPRKYYDDDEAAKQRQIDAREAGLKAGQAEGASIENGYVPQGGITIGRN